MVCGAGVVTVLVEVVSCVTSVRRWLLVVTGEMTVVPPEVIVISGVAVVVSCVVERFTETTRRVCFRQETYARREQRLIRSSLPLIVWPQNTVNVTLQCVRLNIAAVKGNKYCIF